MQRMRLPTCSSWWRPCSGKGVGVGANQRVQLEPSPHGMEGWSCSDCECVFSNCPACRENQQLRAEQAALEQRLRLAGTASAAAAADGHAAHAAVAAAEAEAHAARQQLAAVQAQLAEAEGVAERARGDAHAAQAAARKLETDLEDLSAAYSTLDAHSGLLQQQLDALQAELAAARQGQGSPDTAAGAGAAAAAAAAGGGLSEAEVERRVAAARAEAAAEAQAEADESMTDLLVCLGQEEAKVGGWLGGGAVSWADERLARLAAAGGRTGIVAEQPACKGCSHGVHILGLISMAVPTGSPQVARLRERLEALGVDADALVADIVAAGEGEQPLGDDLT